MQRSKAALTILVLTGCLYAGTITPYVSPGAMWSWNFNGGSSLTLKISIGCYYETYTGQKANPYFSNLTFGKRFLVDFSQNEPDYFFTEIESGFYSGFLVSGAGLGAAYFKRENKLIVVPKASLFTGDGLFLRSDFILDNRKLDIDLGAMLVAPLGEYLFHSYSFSMPNYD